LVAIDVGTAVSSVGPVTATAAGTCQDTSSSSLSRSSEDLSLTDDHPPPLPTSPIPTEPLIPYSTDLSDVQVTCICSCLCMVKNRFFSRKLYLVGFWVWVLLFFGRAVRV